MVWCGKRKKKHDEKGNGKDNGRKGPEKMFKP